jgi:hypothetical protein
LTFGGLKATGRTKGAGWSNRIPSTPKCRDRSSGSRHSAARAKPTWRTREKAAMPAPDASLTGDRLLAGRQSVTRPCLIDPDQRIALRAVVWVDEFERVGSEREERRRPARQRLPFCQAMHHLPHRRPNCRCGCNPATASRFRRWLIRATSRSAGPVDRTPSGCQIHPAEQQSSPHPNQLLGLSRTSTAGRPASRPCFTARR